MHPIARVLVLFSIVVGGGCADDIDAVAVDGGETSDAGVVEARAPWLRDDSGGVLVVRGTNVEGAAKSAADHLPRQGLDDFIALREDLGINAIRLLVFWQAIEPEEGVYDDAYLAAVRAVAMEAGGAGLFVVVDMHQDIFGEGFGFAGAPRWACDEALYATFEPPAEWFQGYFEPEVMACFDRLYGDEAVRTAFVRAWARLARELADVTGILAYELMNEPSWGSETPQVFDREIAPSFYAELADAIRAEDPRPAVAIEPASSANVGLSTSLVPPPHERLIYAPHYYPIAVERGEGYDGDTAGLRRQLAVIVRDAASLRLPPLITELGARPDVPGAAAYVRDIYDLLDEHALGAMQWEIRGGYDLVDDTGAPTEIGLAVARPYPARTAGEPIAFAWDETAGVFTFEWNEDGSAAGETIVMVPRAVFPGGFDALIEDGGAIAEDGARLRIAQVGGRRALSVTRRMP